MGSGTFNPHDWDHFTTSSVKGKTRDEIFSRHVIRDDFDPRNIGIRESCDSIEHPNSTPIIIALDVTGSMGKIPESLVRDGLARLATEIIERQPVLDPQIMFMAVGDEIYDGFPLQATQFESDIRIAEQLKDLYLEGGGGGNDCEGYHLPWYFAARKTSIDSYNKRGRKGLLFTIGDECLPQFLGEDPTARIFGDVIQGPIKSTEILKMVEEKYDVFHLMIEEGSHYRRHGEQVRESWVPVLGQRAMRISDYTKIPEVIVSTLQVMAGKPKEDIANSWDHSTAVVVRNAINDLVPGHSGASDGKIWRPKSSKFAPGGM